jgi:hypothetical protein
MSEGAGLNNADLNKFWDDDTHRVLDFIEKTEKERGLKWHQDVEWLKAFPIDGSLSLNIDLVILSKTTGKPFSQVLAPLDELTAKARDNSLAPEIIEALVGIRSQYVQFQKDYDSRPKP